MSLLKIMGVDMNLPLQPARLQKRKNKKSEKGMAIVEAIPVLFMLALVFNFSLGFFGAVHSGIMNSIGAYNYTMETFRFRSDLMYFRPGAGMTNYKKSMNRVHGITADGYRHSDADKAKWPATVRRITFNKRASELTLSRGPASHAYADKDSGGIWSTGNKDFRLDSEDGGPETAEIWIKTVYGICLNAECTPKD